MGGACGELHNIDDNKSVIRVFFEYKYCRKKGENSVVKACINNWNGQLGRVNTENIRNAFQ